MILLCNLIYLNAIKSHQMTRLNKRANAEKNSKVKNQIWEIEGLSKVYQVEVCQVSSHSSIWHQNMVGFGDEKNL